MTDNPTCPTADPQPQPSNLVWGYGPPVNDYTPGTWYIDVAASDDADNVYFH